MAKPMASFLPDPSNDEPATAQGGMELDMGPADTQENDDGSMTVSFGDNDDKPDPASVPFGANLAESMDDNDLASLSGELLELFEADNASRAEWERTYIDGMDLLGINTEDRTKPWPGSCGVYHPVLAEAVVRFEAQAIMEIFPPQGPAKTKIMGEETADLIAQAQRVQTELNYILTKKMTDYRDETESLLFRLPLAGSAFRKVYYDETLKRPAAKFVPAEDFVVAYGESDLRTAGRYTQVDRISANMLKKRQHSGFYRDCDLVEPVAEESRIQAKTDELTGIKPAGMNDDRYTVLEMHVELDLPGFEDVDADGEETGIGLPYIVSIEKNSGKVLAVYRNWKQDDPLREKKTYFVHYKYLPGLGFYGFGLIHLVGGLAKSSTSILRQLVDAGTLSNLPGGLKSRGLRIKGDDSPIRPGEFRDVDVPAGKITDSIAFLPYKEPSMVLYQLLGQIVDEARRVGSIADLEVGDMKQEAPVGTTLALMERALKVMSAVQARNHYSLEQELCLIGDVVEQFMPPEYDYNKQGNFNRQQDFAGVDIIPVSDPGATTMSQRVVQYQAVIQLASQNPQIYDMRKLNLDMLNVLGIKDASSLVPDPSDIPMADPVSENQAVLNGSPVKAYPEQDHAAHMAVHSAFLNDPKIKAMVGQSPQAGMMENSMAAHMAQHLGFAYRNQIEEQLGTTLPPQGQPLPPEVEASLSRLIAEAAPQLLAQHQQDAAQQQAQQTAQDPLIQLQQQELAIKQTQMQLKHQIDQARVELDTMVAAGKELMAQHKIESEKQIAGMKIAADAREKASQVIHETTQRHKDRELQAATSNAQGINQITGKAIDVAGKLAVEKIKPRPEPGGAE
jgi:hypothetical protein